MNKMLMTLALASCLTATYHTHTAAEAAAQEQVFPVVPYVNAIGEFVSKQHANASNHAQPTSQKRTKQQLTIKVLTSESGRKFIVKTKAHKIPLQVRLSIVQDQIGLLQSGISIAIQPNTPASSVIPAMQPKGLSLDAQLLQTLQACTQENTPKLNLMGKVESLLAQKANPNTTDKSGDSALHHAVRPYYSSTLNTHHFRSHCIDELETCFCHENIENLILAGANPDSRNNKGETAEQYLENMVRKSAYNRTICVTKTKCTLDTLREAIAEKKARDAQAQQNQPDQESQNAYAAE